jgi:hypothetical protein
MAEPKQAEFSVAQRLNAAKPKQSVDGAPDVLSGFTFLRLRFFLFGSR